MRAVVLTGTQVTLVSAYQERRRYADRTMRLALFLKGVTTADGALTADGVRIQELLLLSSPQEAGQAECVPEVRRLRDGGAVITLHQNP